MLHYNTRGRVYLLERVPSFFGNTSRLLFGPHKSPCIPILSHFWLCVDHEESRLMIKRRNDVSIDKFCYTCSRAPEENEARIPLGLASLSHYTPLPTPTYLISPSLVSPQHISLCATKIFMRLDLLPHPEHTKLPLAGSQSPPGR